MRAFPLLAMRGAGALLLSAALAVPAAAQDRGGELPSWHVPGWSFTPGIEIGSVYDTNVAITGPDVNGKTAADTLFQFEPSGQLEFFSPRTSFSSGYRGSLRRYFDLGDLDSLDHRAYLNLRHRVSRRLTIFADDSFSQLPTTDVLELNGLPFARVGSRYNEAAGGLDARLTKALDLNVRYEMTWVDFRLLQDGPTELTGGTVQGIRTQLKDRLTERASVGGEYGVRWADLNAGTRQFIYQDSGGVFEYRTGENTLLEVAGGFSHLQNRNTDLTRTSPYARVGITHHAARAAFGADYRRSYSPSFFLGGSHQGQEIRSYVDMPFSRNRLYLQGMVTYRQSTPVVVTESPLKTIWARSGLGYTVQRWLRVEGYYLYMHQDNRLAGGHIKRQMLGMQLVLSEPVRIR